MTRVPLYPRQVVCTEERRRYARLVREFSRGAITNDEYEDRVDEITGRDTAVWHIHSRLMWFLYDDLHEHRLRGDHRITRPIRKEIARALLFLYTDSAGNTWDCRGCWARVMLPGAVACAIFFALPFLVAFGPPVIQALSAVCLILIYSISWLAGHLAAHTGPTADRVWPFLSEDDELDARSRPLFLAGLSTDRIMPVSTDRASRRDGIRT